MTESETKSAVRARDGGRCVKCGLTSAESRDQYGRDLDVHRTTPGSAYSLAPGACVTLCIDCHAREKRTFSSRQTAEYRYRIAAEIRHARRVANCSAKSLAERIGISRPALSRIESGAHWPTLRTLLLIADALKVPICSLLDPPGAEPKPARKGKKP